MYARIFSRLRRPFSCVLCPIVHTDIDPFPLRRPGGLLRGLPLQEEKAFPVPLKDSDESTSFMKKE